VLLRRRPVDERDEIDLVEVTRNVRTDVLVGHVRRPTVGSLRTENTHPFRYRQWLFAQTGTIGGFNELKDRLLESQPEFLRRNVRGDTDSELFFYLFLSFLHDAGHLDDPNVGPDHIRAALRASISLVDRLSAEESHSANRGDLLVTNGEYLIAVHRGDAMAYRVLRGRHDVEELLGDDGMHQARIPNVDTTQFSIVATGLAKIPPQWRAVDDQVLLTMTRTEEPGVEAL
jgi:glutamine amidotransferase